MAEHDDLSPTPVKKTGNYVWNQTLNGGIGDWERWDGGVDIDMATEGIATEATLAQIRDEEYGLNDLEEASATVTYAGYEKSTGEWLLKKIDETTGMAIGYATITNNPTRTTYTLGWTNRATLTYEDYSSAL
jgi:hypothetical protein